MAALLLRRLGSARGGPLIDDRQPAVNPKILPNSGAAEKSLKHNAAILFGTCW
jgi:hypothetical protein